MHTARSNPAISEMCGGGRSLARWLVLGAALACVASAHAAPPTGATALQALTTAVQAGSIPAAAAQAAPILHQASVDEWPAQPSTPGKPVLRRCTLPGVSQARCGWVERPLDPARPDGPRIPVRFVVLPSVAQGHLPDPVYALAGGPGQSAVSIAHLYAAGLQRLQAWRELVLVDQRGTGRSAPLNCPEPAPTAPLAESFDAARIVARAAQCRLALQRLPYGDLRQYTTLIAAADLDAVRAALGHERINMVGVSYGTRLGLEYLRQFPARVRRLVLDGVAPPDMQLPQSIAQDAQAATSALWRDCAAERRCAQRFAGAAGQWQALLDGPARSVTLTHPVTGVPETVLLDGEAVESMVRGMLYAPLLASMIPFAVDQAARGNFEPLVGGAMALGPAPMRDGPPMALGMHLAVVCSEDMAGAAGSGESAAAPVARTAAVTSPATAAAPASAAPAAGSAARLEAVIVRHYRRMCAGWPRAELPAAFRRVAPARMPVWVLSGGIDPATPARHGERIAKALGANARHIVVPMAGHGLMLQTACVGDAVYRFIDATTDEQALAVDGRCAAAIPRPPFYAPPLPASARADAASSAGAGAGVAVGVSGSASASMAAGPSASAPGVGR